MTVTTSWTSYQPSSQLETSASASCLLSQADIHSTALHLRVIIAMSLAVIQENEEDDSPENDLLTLSSTIHHKTRRETAFSLDGALISR